MYDIVLYHANCADGFTAAWVMHKSGIVKDGAEYVPVNYDDKDYPDVTDKHVLIVDFSYKADQLREMVEVGKAKSITILDHHKTAAEELEEFIVGIDGEVTLDDPDLFWEGSVALEVEPIRAWFDMDRSGAQLAWSYVYGEGTEVELVNYVGNRDLWRLDALPNIREVHAWLMAHDFDFGLWSEAQEKLESTEGFNVAMLQGKAILRTHDKNVRDWVSLVRRQMIIGGHTVPVANVPYFMASDAAHLMDSEPGVPFAATYFDNSRGQRKFSLRSNREHGIDVSEIAKQYGGGGHKNAASFTLDCRPGYDPLGEGSLGIEVVPTFEVASD